jgi:hypothetical protein
MPMPKNCGNLSLVKITVDTWMDQMLIKWLASTSQAQLIQHSTADEPQTNVGLHTDGTASLINQK